MQTTPIPVETALQYRLYEPAEPTSSSKLRVIIPLSIALIAGTGGAYGASNISYASSVFQNPIIQVRGNEPRREILISVAQQVILIRDALGLKMSELAQIFGVTRPTAYAWINGSEPKPEIKIKIFRLRRFVDELHGAGIARLDRFTRIPLYNGKSLLDSLKADSGLEDATAAIKRTASQQRLDHAEIELGRANRKRIADLDDISTAIVG